MSTWARTRSSSRRRIGRISKSLFRPRKTRSTFPGLVRLHRGAGAERVAGEAGADRVDAVQRGLLHDLVLIPPPGDPAVGDLDDEVLGDLLLADHHAHGQADGVLAAQRAARWRGSC